MNPSSRWTGEFRTESIEWETSSPHRWIGSLIDVLDERTEHTSLPYQSVLTPGETFESVPPAARRTLLGCQSTLRMVLRMGFLRCLLTHQSPSSSKLHTLMARALDPHANLFSSGDHRTKVAALLRRSKTSVGFQVPSLCDSQTYALRCEIRKAK